MSEPEELSFYEYWLTKPYWNASWAIQMLLDHKKYKRSWEEYEDYDDVTKGFKNQIIERMSKDDAIDMFVKRVCSTDGYDPDLMEWKKGELNVYTSEVIPENFIRWAYDKGYYMPYEFKEFIGVVEKEEKRTTKEAEGIDRLVCQGIAKTIWYYEPEMSNHKMQEHEAIQVYAGGKGYPDTTLQKWISAVDKRVKKRGRKKKLI